MLFNHFNFAFKGREIALTKTDKPVIGNLVIIVHSVSTEKVSLFNKQTSIEEQERLLKYFNHPSALHPSTKFGVAQFAQPRVNKEVVKDEYAFYSHTCEEQLVPSLNYLMSSIVTIKQIAIIEDVLEGTANQAVLVKTLDGQRREYLDVIKKPEQPLNENYEVLFKDLITSACKQWLKELGKPDTSFNLKTIFDTDVPPKLNTPIPWSVYEVFRATIPDKEITIKMFDNILTQALIMSRALDLPDVKVGWHDIASAEKSTDTTDFVKDFDQKVEIVCDQLRNGPIKKRKLSEMLLDLAHLLKSKYKQEPTLLATYCSECIVNKWYLLPQTDILAGITVFKEHATQIRDAVAFSTTSGFTMWAVGTYPDRITVKL